MIRFFNSALSDAMFRLSPFYVLPVLSGASYSLGSIITYRYLSDESPMAIIMSFFVAIGFCGGLVALSFALFPVSDELSTQAPFLFAGWQLVGAGFWFWMLVIAVGASLALSLITRNYQIANTSCAAIYEYAYLLSAGVFGWMFWDITPDFTSLAGILFIVIAGILIVLVRQDLP